MLDFLLKQLDYEVKRGTVKGEGAGATILPSGRYVQIKHHIQGLKVLLN